MTRYCLYNIPHTYVYQRSRYLTAGTQYIFETRDLRAGWFSTPDTYMYLIRDDSVVARNDDYNGYASLIAYQPSVTGYYRLVIRGYSKNSGGTCDVYQSTGGGSPSRIDNDVAFGGYPVSAHWKSDERIETTNATGDTYLFLMHGNTMLRNDDGGQGLHSRITPGNEGWGTVIVGSWSHYTEGSTRLCNYYQSFLDNPGLSEEGIDDPGIIISEKIFKFQTELMNYKASLEKLSLQEQTDMPLRVREEEINKLRDRILSADDIRQLQAPQITVPREYIAALKRYDKLLKEAEPKLANLSVAKRAVEMAKVEQQKREIFRNLVPQEET